MSRRLLAGVATVLLAAQPGTAQAPTAAGADPDLAKGVRQVSDGLFEVAVFTLDSVAQRLASQPDRADDLARADLYLGVALAGLGDPQRAKEAFRKALAADHGIRLDSRGTQKSAAAFEQAAALLRSAWRETQAEEARRQWASGVGAPPASPGVSATPAAPSNGRGESAKQGGGGSKAPLVILGVAAVGGGVALAAGGGGGSTPVGGTGGPTTPTTTAPAAPSAPSAPVSFLSSTPPPGSSLRVSRTPDRHEVINLAVRLAITGSSNGSAAVSASLYDANSRDELGRLGTDCFVLLNPGGAALTAGRAVTVDLGPFRRMGDVSCVAPFSTQLLRVSVTGMPRTDVSVTYQFVP